LGLHRLFVGPTDYFVPANCPNAGQPRQFVLLSKRISLTWPSLARAVLRAAAARAPPAATQPPRRRGQPAVRKGNDTTSRARSLAVRGGQDAGCRILVGFNYNLPPPALGERRHRGLARRLVAVHRSARYAAGGGGGGFGGLGGGGLGGRGGKMATRKVKCGLVVVISVLFCPNLPRPARPRGRAWEAATTAAAAKAAANNS